MLQSQEQVTSDKLFALSAKLAAALDARSLGMVIIFVGVNRLLTFGPISAGMM